MSQMKLNFIEDTYSSYQMNQLKSKLQSIKIRFSLSSYQVCLYEKSKLERNSSQLSILLCLVLEMKLRTRLLKCIILDHTSVKEDKLANFFQVKDMRFSTWEIPGLSRLTQTYPNIFEDFQKHSKDVQKDAPNILPLPVTRKRPGNGQLSFNNPPALRGTSDNQLPVLDPASLPRSPLSPASSSACDPTLWYTGHTEAEEPAC